MGPVRGKPAGIVMARQPARGTKPVPEVPFEERLARLEALVGELEGGELSLEEGVSRYREGVELLQALHEALLGAEGKVEKLTEVLRRGLEELEAEGEERPGENDDA